MTFVSQLPTSTRDAFDAYRSARPGNQAVAISRSRGDVCRSAHWGGRTPASQYCGLDVYRLKNEETRLVKLKVDEQSDALYLRINEDAIVESEEVQPGVILDYDAQGRVVGVELLRIHDRAAGASLGNLIFETA